MAAGSIQQLVKMSSVKQRGVFGSIGHDIRELGQAHELGQTHVSAQKRGKGSARGSTPTATPMATPTPALSEEDLERIKPRLTGTASARALATCRQQAAGSEAARERLQRETSCPAVSGINVTHEQTACPTISGIDKLVYELYGLTEEEIKIVET